MSSPSHDPYTQDLLLGPDEKALVETLIQTLDMPPLKEPEEMLTKAQMAKQLSVSTKQTSLLYKTLEKEWKNRKEGQISIIIENIEWPIEKMGIFGPQKTFKLHKSLETHVRDALSIPPKEPEGMLTLKEMAKNIRADRTTVQPLYKKLEKVWKNKAEGQNIVTIEGITWPADQMGIFKNNVRQTFKLHKSLEEKAKKVLKILPFTKELDGMLVYTQMEKRLRVNRDILKEFYQTLKSSWQENKEKQDSFILKNVKWPIDKMGIFGSQRAFKIHKSLDKEIGEALNVELKKSNLNVMLTNNQMTQALKIDRRNQNIRTLYQELETKYNSKSDNQESITLKNLEWPVNKIALLGTGQNRRLRLHRSLKENVRQALDLPPQEPEGMLAYDAMWRIAKTRDYKTKALYQDLYMEWKNASKTQSLITVRNIEWPTNKMGIFGPNKAFKLHNSLVGLIQETLEKEANSKKQWQESVTRRTEGLETKHSIQKKDILPEAIRLEQHKNPSQERTK